MSHLFCFGLGYSAQRVAGRLASAGWSIGGTARTAEGAAAIAAQGFAAYVFDGSAPGGGVETALDQASHLLISVPPESETGFKS